MEGLTISTLLELWISAILKYWVLIAGAITLISVTYKYLNKRAIQQQKNNDLLGEILVSSVSMDKTVKDMLERMTSMNLEVKVLRKEHDNLAESHSKLEKRVDYIKRKRNE